MTCHECGRAFSIDDNGVATHDAPDDMYSLDGIDHDADADHVPFELDDDGDDDTEPTPDEEDGFVFGRAEASFAGKYLGAFKDESAAEAAIRSEGNTGAGFFPNVWRVSDHGNHHLILDFWSDDKERTS